MKAHEKVWKAVEDQRERYTLFLQDLVRESEGGEPATQVAVAEKFHQLGCAVDVRAYAPQEVVVRHEFASAESIDAAQRTCVVGRYCGTGRRLVAGTSARNPMASGRVRR